MWGVGDDAPYTRDGDDHWLGVFRWLRAIDWRDDYGVLPDGGCAMSAPVSTLFLLPSSGFVYHGRVGGKPRHDYSLEATVFLASANGRHMAGIYEVRGESYEQVASIYRPQAGEVSR